MRSKNAALERSSEYVPLVLMNFLKMYLNVIFTIKRTVAKEDAVL